MNLLLDTHTFIWWASSSDKLPPAVRAGCSDPANALLLSVVSVWEMQIKIQLGKLQVGGALADLVEHHKRVNRMQILPVGLEHVLALGTLPAHHKDPFDRLLIAQATVEDLFLVSGDPVFSSYPISYSGDESIGVRQSGAIERCRIRRTEISSGSSSR